MISRLSSSFQTSDLKVKKHSIFHIVLIFLSLITFLFMVFINLAAAQTSIGIFDKPTRNISDENQVDITPDGWTFSTWGLIYIWQGLWLIFNIFLIFKRTDLGLLYQEPPVLTPLFHFVILFNFVINIIWLVIWEKEELTAAFFLLALIAISLYVAAFISHRNIYNAEPLLAKKQTNVYIWLYRALVNNGLAFYATWVTVAAFVNLAIAITYDWADASKIEEFKETSSIIALSILSVLYLAYFVLDIIIFEKYLRYTFSPYIQLAIAFAGILTKQWSSDSSPAIFVLVLAILNGLMFLVKIVLSLYNHRKRGHQNF